MGDRRSSIIATATLVVGLTACANPASIPGSALTPIAVPPSPVSVQSPTTSGPAAGPAPAAAGPSTQARYPADVLDLTNWYLTLPTGREDDPDTVNQPDLATYGGTWFRLNDTRDGVVFTADAGGATTSGSDYPRSELRETSGAELAGWSNTSGTHTLDVRQAVLGLPLVKPEVVTAQIHDTDDDVLEVRLDGERLLVQYDDGNSEITIDPAYRLGTVYDLRIVAADGRVQVYYNGVRKAEIAKRGSGWYFKTGSYVQSNTDKGDAADAVGEVVIHALQVTHSR